jgi:hypothetical protein
MPLADEARRDLGYVKSSIDVRKYLDESIVNETAARLR